jgi:hypothetical protein
MTSTSDWIVAASTAAGAVGTVGTLVFLAWQGVSDRRETRREKHRAQAKKVNCWLEIESIQDTGELPSELQRTVTAKVHWQNLNKAPISQLEVFCRLEPRLISGRPVPFADTVLPEHGPNPERIAATVAPRSGSSQHVEYTFRGFGAASPPEGTEPVLTWWFTDAAGVYWRRNSRGGFVELKPDPEQAEAIWAGVHRAAFHRRPGPS